MTTLSALCKLGSIEVPLTVTIRKTKVKIKPTTTTAITKDSVQSKQATVPLLFMLPFFGVLYYFVRAPGFFVCFLAAYLPPLYGLLTVLLLTII